MIHHKRGAFRTKRHQIIPKGATFTGYSRPSAHHKDIVITIYDRLSFREKVHIGDRVRISDVGLEGAESSIYQRKDGVICGLYPRIVLVQTQHYVTAFSYDELMLHDHAYLIEDKDYLVRGTAPWEE